MHVAAVVDVLLPDYMVAVDVLHTGRSAPGDRETCTDSCHAAAGMTRSLSPEMMSLDCNNFLIYILGY